jgi:hypothetical protein
MQEVSGRVNGTSAPCDSEKKAYKGTAFFSIDENELRKQ